MPRKYIPPEYKYPLYPGSMYIIAETCTTASCVRKALDEQTPSLQDFCLRFIIPPENKYGPENKYLFRR